MSTGVVQKLGLVRGIQPDALTIDLPLSFRERLSIGGGIAVSGVCLSARELSLTYAIANLSKKTNTKATLGRLRTDQQVDLKLPRSPIDNLDGHWVLELVDAVGRIQAMFRATSSRTFIVGVSDTASKVCRGEGIDCSRRHEPDSV